MFPDDAVRLTQLVVLTMPPQIDFANCLLTGLDAVPDEDILKAFCAFDVNDSGARLEHADGHSQPPAFLTHAVGLYIACGKHCILSIGYITAEDLIRMMRSVMTAKFSGLTVNML
jgi:hypothetical protein